jgi:TRAP transporter TAXI family solute receptor
MIRAGCLLALIGSAAGSLACGSTSASTAAPRQISFHTGPTSGVYWQIGQALTDIYNATIPEAHVTAHISNELLGASANVDALESGEAELGFARSDIAYTTFRGGSSRNPNPYLHLRALAVVYTNVVHVAVRRGSGITSWRDMRGKRVQISDEASGGGSGSLARLVLEGHGIDVKDIQVVTNPRGAIARLRAGEMDVRIFASAYPVSTITDVGESSDMQLLPLESDAIERVRSRSPFFKPAVIPARTYPGQTADIQTVGIDGLLLCRDSMPESLAYAMTRRLFAAIPDLARALPAARLINVGRAPATPVPLHPGAARYYRERDLFR